MHILFISEFYYPYTSGVPVVVKYLAEELAKTHRVSVITTMCGTNVDYEVLNNVEINRVNVFIDSLKFYRGEKNAFINKICKIKADVLIFECASCVTTDIVLPYLNSISGKKYLHSHGFSALKLKPFEKMQTIKNTIGNTYNYFRWNFFFDFVMPKYINDFDGVFCLSTIDSSYDYLKEKYNGKVGVLGNAADDMFFEYTDGSIKDYLDIKGKGYYISVANYMSVKNQIGILEEYYRAVSSDMYDLVFVGTKENEYLDKLKKKNSLYNNNGRVHFLVGVDRKSIPLLLSKATLYLAGSRAEGFSISLIESMAKSIPFVSTNVGNAKELPGGVTIESMTEMSGMIDRLMNDNNLYKNLAKNGKEYAMDNCRIDIAAKRLLELIEG